MLKSKALLLTQGMHGMISQVEGLSKALGLKFKHENIKLKNIWNFVPPKFTPITEGILENRFNFIDEPAWWNRPKIIEKLLRKIVNIIFRF